MIAGGYTVDGWQNSVSLWAPQKKQCSLPSLPPSPNSSRGWIFFTIDWIESHETLVACLVLHCIQFKSGKWSNLGNMTHRRFHHTSAVIGNHLLLVGGSSDDSGMTPQNTTEYISFEDGTSVEGPQMVFARDGHCSIQVDSSTIILTGGRTEDTIVNSVVQYSELGVNKQSTSTELSLMKKARALHACGQYKRSKGIWHDPEQVI